MDASKISSISLFSFVEDKTDSNSRWVNCDDSANIPNPEITSETSEKGTSPRVSPQPPSNDSPQPPASRSIVLSANRSQSLTLETKKKQFPIPSDVAEAGDSESEGEQNALDPIAPLPLKEDKEIS
jgi:hypothetical protein